MGMKRFRESVELDSNFEPIVPKRADILKNMLPYLATLSVYLLLIDLGFFLASCLECSPVISAVAKFFGFFASVFGWMSAFLSFGIFRGNFQFAKEVFFLFREVNFGMSILFVCMGFIPARIFAGVLTRIEIPYAKSLKILYVALAVTLISICMLSVLAGRTSEDPGKYYFTYLLMGIPYILFAGTHLQKRQSESDFYRQARMKQRNSFPEIELERIFRDLAN